MSEGREPLKKKQKTLDSFFTAKSHEKEQNACENDDNLTKTSTSVSPTTASSLSVASSNLQIESREFECNEDIGVASRNLSHLSVKDKLKLVEDPWKPSHDANFQWPHTEKRDRGKMIKMSLKHNHLTGEYQCFDYNPYFLYLIT